MAVAERNQTRCPVDLSQSALRAAMNIEALRNHQTYDMSTAKDFFHRLATEFGIDSHGGMRSLMPSQRDVMSRALTDASAPGSKSEPERAWDDLRKALMEVGIVSDTSPDDAVRMERLMKFCLTIHRELLLQREQRLSHGRRRR